MKRVAIVTTVWRRRATLTAWFAWVEHVRRWWASRAEPLVIAATSLQDDTAFVQSQPLALALELPNVLGAKWNATLRAARGLDVDAVLVMGADDFTDRRYAEGLLWALDAAQGGPAWAGALDMYFYDLARHRVGWFPGYTGDRAWEPNGAGLLLTRPLLEALEWWAWPPERHAGADPVALARIRSVAAEAEAPFIRLFVRENGAVLLDLKEGANLWSFDDVGPVELAPRYGPQLLGRLPADVVARWPAVEPPAEDVRNVLQWLASCEPEDYPDETDLAGIRQRLKRVLAHLEGWRTD